MGMKNALARYVRKLIPNQCKVKRKNRDALCPKRSYFDSPVIYGVRVETSNPYHLQYIESNIQF